MLILVLKLSIQIELIKSIKVNKKYLILGFTTGVTSLLTQISISEDSISELFKEENTSSLISKLLNKPNILFFVAIPTGLYFYKLHQKEADHREYTPLKTALINLSKIGAFGVGCIVAMQYLHSIKTEDKDIGGVELALASIMIAPSCVKSAFQNFDTLKGIITSEREEEIIDNNHNYKFIIQSISAATLFGQYFIYSSSVESLLEMSGVESDYSEFFAMMIGGVATNLVSTVDSNDALKNLTSLKDKPVIEAITAVVQGSFFSLPMVALTLKSLASFTNPFFKILVAVPVLISNLASNIIDITDSFEKICDIIPLDQQEVGLAADMIADINLVD